MFCSNCGAEGSGNYCSKCGNALPHDRDSSSTEDDDWSQEVVYDNLIRIAAVRDMISRHATMAKKHFSGEEFLALCDQLVPVGVPLESLGAFAQTIYARLGVKTGQERSETLSEPPGTVIVSALCSLARNGQALRQVRQFEDGCLLEAKLPSDIWSFEGTLCVGVQETESGTRVEGVTKIQGQWFDWGKSRRCLETLFTDIKAMPA